jgi:hypothetical protein
MKVFSSNRDLYDYLLALQARLGSGGANALRDVVGIAIGNASSMGTEFLGESRIALRQVWKEERGILSDQERRDLSDVLKQLDAVMGGR